MMDALDTLLERSSAAIGQSIAETSVLPDDLKPIENLLRGRNGFWAAQSGLHVLPYDEEVTPNIQLNKQIEEHLNRYPTLNNPIVFAFDTYGMPFLFDSNGFAQLDYETGTLAPMGRSVEEWAQILIEDFSMFTAYPVAEAWQNENGPIPTGKRLFPARPFIMGGEYAPSNLTAIDIRDGIGAASEMYLQTKDLPDGSEVRIVVTN